jgi:hypothetical protein
MNSIYEQLTQNVSKQTCIKHLCTMYEPCVWTLIRHGAELAADVLNFRSYIIVPSLAKSVEETYVTGRLC